MTVATAATSVDSAPRTGAMIWPATASQPRDHRPARHVHREAGTIAQHQHPPPRLTAIDAAPLRGTPPDHAPLRHAARLRPAKTPAPSIKTPLTSHRYVHACAPDINRDR